MYYMILLVNIAVGVIGVESTRLLYPPPRNFLLSDADLNCGGVEHQWKYNDGKCGLCGDSWDSTREHEIQEEFPEIFALNGQTGEQTVNILAQVPSKSKGYIEVRLCQQGSKQLTQECLDKNLLFIEEANSHRYDVVRGEFQVPMTLRIPDNVKCERCVLQWKFIQENERCQKCKEKETFINCADISIMRPEQSKETTPNHRVKRQLSQPYRPPNSVSTRLKPTVVPTENIHWLGDKNLQKHIPPQAIISKDVYVNGEISRAQLHRVQKVKPQSQYDTYNPNVYQYNTNSLSKPSQAHRFQSVVAPLQHNPDNIIGALSMLHMDPSAVPHTQDSVVTGNSLGAVKTRTDILLDTYRKMAKELRNETPSPDMQFVVDPGVTRQRINPGVTKQRLYTQKPPTTAIFSMRNHYNRNDKVYIPSGYVSPQKKPNNIRTSNSLSSIQSYKESTNRIYKPTKGFTTRDSAPATRAFRFSTRTANALSVSTGNKLSSGPNTNNANTVSKPQNTIPQSAKQPISSTTGSLSTNQRPDVSRGLTVGGAPLKTSSLPGGHTGSNTQYPGQTTGNTVQNRPSASTNNAQSLSPGTNPQNTRGNTQYTGPATGNTAQNRQSASTNNAQSLSSGTNPQNTRGNTQYTGQTPGNTAQNRQSASTNNAQVLSSGTNPQNTRVSNKNTMNQPGINQNPQGTGRLSSNPTQPATNQQQPSNSNTGFVQSQFNQFKNRPTARPNSNYMGITDLTRVLSPSAAPHLGGNKPRGNIPPPNNPMQHILSRGSNPATSNQPTNQQPTNQQRSPSGYIPPQSNQPPSQNTVPGANNPSAPYQSPNQNPSNTARQSQNTVQGNTHNVGHSGQSHQTASAPSLEKHTASVLKNIEKSLQMMKKMEGKERNALYVVKSKSDIPVVMKTLEMNKSKSQTADTKPKEQNAAELYQVGGNDQMLNIQYDTGFSGSRNIPLYVVQPEPKHTKKPGSSDVLSPGSGNVLPGVKTKSSMIPPNPPPQRGSQQPNEPSNVRNQNALSQSGSNLPRSNTVYEAPVEPVQQGVKLAGIPDTISANMVIPQSSQASSPGTSQGSSTNQMKEAAGKPSQPSSSVGRRNNQQPPTQKPRPGSMSVLDSVVWGAPVVPPSSGPTIQKPKQTASSSTQRQTAPSASWRPKFRVGNKPITFSFGFRNKPRSFSVSGSSVFKMPQKSQPQNPDPTAYSPTVYSPTNQLEPKSNTKPPQAYNLHNKDTFVSQSSPRTSRDGISMVSSGLSQSSSGQQVVSSSLSFSNGPVHQGNMRDMPIDPPVEPPAQQTGSSSLMSAPAGSVFVSGQPDMPSGGRVDRTGGQLLNPGHTGSSLGQPMVSSGFSGNTMNNPNINTNRIVSDPLVKTGGGTVVSGSVSSGRSDPIPTSRVLWSSSVSANQDPRIMYKDPTNPPTNPTSQTPGTNPTINQQTMTTKSHMTGVRSPFANNQGQTRGSTSGPRMRETHDFLSRSRVPKITSSRSQPSFSFGRKSRIYSPQALSFRRANQIQSKKTTKRPLETPSPNQTYSTKNPQQHMV